MCHGSKKGMLLTEHAGPGRNRTTSLPTSRVRRDARCPALASLARALSLSLCLCRSVSCSLSISLPLSLARYLSLSLSRSLSLAISVSLSLSLSPSLLSRLGTLEQRHSQLAGSGATRGAQPLTLSPALSPSRFLSLFLSVSLARSFFFSLSLSGSLSLSLSLFSLALALSLSLTHSRALSPPRRSRPRVWKSWGCKNRLRA